MMISDIITSPYLQALLAAWISAHLIKFGITIAAGGRVNLLSQLFISGGMPSSHAATSVAVLIVILLKDGASSGLFGLATLVTLIICYDAVKVRRSAGEQGQALRELIEATKQTKNIVLPRAAKGHTPIEVIAGAVLGVAIAIVVFFATK